MMEITTQEVEFTTEGTLLEVLRVVDVKDSIAPVRLRVREWIDERHYRDVDVSENPVPDFMPEWLAACASTRGRSTQDDTRYRRDLRGRPHTSEACHRPFHRACAQHRRWRETWPQGTPRLPDRA